MRIKASNGKTYNPDKSQTLGARTTPDGKTESLMRSNIGGYFFYTTPEPEIKSKSIVPTTYDDALEWIKKYSDIGNVNGIMVFDDSYEYKSSITVSDKTYQLIRGISSIKGISVYETVDIALEYYAKHLEEIKE